MPSKLNLILAGLVHGLTFLMWTWASTENGTSSIPEDNQGNIITVNLVSEQSPTGDEPRPLPEQLQDESEEELPPVNYKGSPPSGQTDETAEIPVNPADSIAESSNDASGEPIFDSTSTSVEGQNATILDTDGITGPRLRISSLSVSLVDQLIERGLAALIVTDRKGRIYILHGSMTTQTGMSPITELDTRKLSSRAVNLPRSMTNSVYTYLATHWAFAPSDIASVVMHLSNSFDRQILNAQRQAVAQHGFDENHVITTCRFITSDRGASVFVESVEPWQQGM